MFVYDGIEGQPISPAGGEVCNFDSWITDESQSAFTLKFTLLNNTLAITSKLSNFPFLHALAISGHICCHGDSGVHSTTEHSFIYTNNVFFLQVASFPGLPHLTFRLHSQ